MGETPVNVATKRQIETIGPATGGKKPRIESAHLFQGTKEVVILHRNEEYNLRITRNGKLILTK